MKIKLLSLAFTVFIPLFSQQAFATDNDSSDYVKVEIRGTLKTGMMAIGGETTGTVIRMNNLTWELDFGKDKELQELSNKLNNKTVLVTGTYEKRKGVEVRERHIVKVSTLKPAGVE
jgi:hypothetical protein